ncbi:PilZ domain-containing protein [Desulfonema magnum]|uniref:PilZ domain-containing protein n=1 Tax=Desulfonema magnum TaxID=45655 RepID=A0A975BM03_9BACT|nr:PilZ domain-containing protein [Desulfonema magnum]QTA87961.1 PilZ domain-containing protein [Desulfonema magnum]
MTETKKVFINNDNLATFVCPECNKATTADVSDQMQVNKVVKIQHTCACGYSQTVLLERRKYYRKYVNIPGEYFLNQKKMPMTVRDLSRSGLKFELTEERRLKVGDKLVVQFVLDNPQHTRIQKEVIIKKISGLYIGTEFCSRDPNNPIDKAYDVAIGFYTFS